MPPNDRLASIEHELSWQSRKLIHLENAVGQSPDPALGKPGTGICGQLSLLVRQQEDMRRAQEERDARSESWRNKMKAIAGVATIIGSVVTLLHLFKVL